MGMAAKSLAISPVSACLSVVCPKCKTDMMSQRFEFVVSGMIVGALPASDLFRCPKCNTSYRAEVKYIKKTN